MAILGKAYSIAMMLILVYFLLDAYQIIVTAGRSVNIGSFLSYALPKVLSDAVLVVPFLWFVLDYTKSGYVNPRRLLMLYLLLCSLSGVLSLRVSLVWLRCFSLRLPHWIRCRILPLLRLWCRRLWSG